MESTSKINNSQDIRMNMVTYEVNIDFDEASNFWKQNKKSIGNGQYKYICPKDKKDPFFSCSILSLFVSASRDFSLVLMNRTGFRWL